MLDISEKSAKWFFLSALRQTRLSVTAETLTYVVHVLDAFLSSDTAFAGTGPGKPVLVDFLLRASGNRAATRHIGDLALFLGGVFPRATNVSYYVSIGSMAYGSLVADNVVFCELSDRLGDVVSAVNEVTPFR